MKKLLSMLAAAVMLCSFFTVSAFAAVTPDGNNGTQDVYAKYVSGGYTDTYKVSLSWGSMKFNYKASDSVWDADEHKWVSDDNGEWSAAAAGANEIKVTNSSSVDVTAALAFAPTSGNGVTGGTFTSGGQTVTSVVVSDAQGGSAVTETITFMPSGALTRTNENAADYVSIGKITVTLN